MSRTQHEANLCALLVDDVYGELSSRIFTVLLQRGRLTIPLLIQQTGLKAGLLKQGLVVLIQQNLIYYSRDSRGATFYEANWDAAFALARSGRILDLVESRFGEKHKDVVQNLLLLGHTKVGDLVQAYALKRAILEKAAAKTNAHSNGHTNGAGEDVNMTNGDSHKAGLTHGQLDGILYQLLECGYLEPVTAEMFKSTADAYNEFQQQAVKDGSDGGAKGSKKAVTLTSMIRSQLRERREKNSKWQHLTKGNNKRPRDGYDSMDQDKRRKLTNGTSVNGASPGDGEETIRLDPNLTVRVNHEKLAVALRNRHLTELAEGYIGVTTSLVYSTLLSLMEDKIPRCRLDPIIDDPDMVGDYPEISMMTIEANLPKSIDLSQGISKPRKEGKAAKGEFGSDEDVDMDQNNHKEGEDSDSEADPFRPLTPARSSKVTFEDKKPVEKRVRQEQVRQHLLLLAADKRKFVRQVGGQGRLTWTVDFEPLGEFLKDHELETVVFAKFQEKGLRLVRVLKEKGRLDEKQISNIALMKKMDVQQLLIEMQMAGFVDIQEVPKDTTRTATKSFFLWYYDEDRVTKLVMDNIYKSMCRSLQRLDVERYRDKEAIETSERTDVNGDMELLSADAAAKLRRFLKKEEFLAGLMAKLDKTAAVFRDY